MKESSVSYFIVMEVEYKDEISPFKDDQLILFMSQRDILLLSIFHPVKPLLQLIECLVEVLQERVFEVLVVT